MAVIQTEGVTPHPIENNPPQYGRREFMRKAARAIVGAGLAASVPGAVFAQDRKPLPVPVTEVHVIPHDDGLTIEAVEIVSSEPYGDITVYFDANKIPIKYDVGEATHLLNKGQRQYLKDRKELAQTEQESYVGYQVLLDQPVEDNTSNSEQSSTAEKPDDIVESERLFDIGISVLNHSSEKGAPQLHLRQSALVGILEPLVIFNNNENADKYWLNIVPFAGPTLSSIYLPDGERSQAFEQFKNDLLSRQDKRNKYQSDKIIELQDIIKQERLILENTRSNTQDRVNAKRELLRAKTQFELYTVTLPAPLLIDEALSRTDGAIGMFTTAYFKDDPTFRGLYSSIYLANPTAEQLAEKRILSFCYLDDGTFDVSSTEYSPAGYKNSRARITQSYPSPDEFPAYEEQGDYLYAPDGLGWVFFHELAHVITVDILPQMQKEGTISESSLYREYFAQGCPLQAQFDEYLLLRDEENRDEKRVTRLEENLVDLLAKSYFEKAYARYQETGDTSLYCFAIEIPPSSSSPGGWQVTESPRKVV